LRSQVNQLFNQSRGSAGSRVRRLMREPGLVSKQQGSHAYKQAPVEQPDIPNWLNREFTTERPNQIWCGDITYIWAQGRWHYLAAVLDLYSCVIVGWAMHHHIQQCPSACCVGDGCGTPPTTGGGTAALGSWQPILRLRLLDLAAAPSDCAQPFTSGELLRQRCDGELLPFAEDRTGLSDELRQLPRSENRPTRLHPLLQSSPSTLDVGLHQPDRV